ncbi:MAG: thiosulfate oxidation carrier protein SoxY [Magnetococcales bacterium]|nr:thiosulfate oxidation carrier protein SoxY [Magnetococcales bacterium]
MEIESNKAISRRVFFRQVGTTGAAVAIAGSALSLAPKAARADGVEALIAEKMGAGEITRGLVSIDTAASADNGALVRMPVKVDHPMEPDNYIESVGLFVDNNPKPFVAQYNFTPECGVVDFECRIKMAKTSKVRAIAKTNSGKLYDFVMEIQVAEGGCAG